MHGRRDDRDCGACLDGPFALADSSHEEALRLRRVVDADPLFGELDDGRNHRVVGNHRCIPVDQSSGVGVEEFCVFSFIAHDLGVPPTAIHLSELNVGTAHMAAARSPVVVRLEGREGRFLFNESDRAGCRGDPDDVFALVQNRLSAHVETSNSQQSGRQSRRIPRQRGALTDAVFRLISLRLTLRHRLRSEQTS